MNTTDIIILIDRLRTMEKKVGLVYTLFRASAYSLVNNNSENNNSDESNKQQINKSNILQK